MAFAQPFFALSIVGTGVMRGAGDAKWPFYISFICMWGIRLGLAYTLAYVVGLGLTGIWLGMITDLILRGLLSLFRVNSKKWLDIWDDKMTM